MQPRTITRHTDVKKFMQGPKQDTDPLPSENSVADPKKFIPDPNTARKAEFRFANTQIHMYSVMQLSHMGL